MNSPEQRSDEDLALEFSQGDHDAGAALAQRYVAGIYDFAIRATLDPAAAQAATVNVLRRVGEEFDSRPDALNVGSWIFGITRDESLNSLHQPSQSDAPSEDSRADTLSVLDPRFLQTDLPASQAQATSWAWQAVRSQRPRDYSILDLLLRRQLTPEEVAEVAALFHNGVYAVLGRLRGVFEETYAAAALFEIGREACLELDELVSQQESIGPAARRAVGRHIEGCEHCRETRQGLPPAADLFASLRNVDLPQKVVEQLRSALFATPQTSEVPEPVTAETEPSDTVIVASDGEAATSASDDEADATLNADDEAEAPGDEAGLAAAAPMFASGSQQTGEVEPGEPPSAAPVSDEFTSEPMSTAGSEQADDIEIEPGEAQIEAPDMGEPPDADRQATFEDSVAGQPAELESEQHPDGLDQTVTDADAKSSGDDLERARAELLAADQDVEPTEPVPAPVPVPVPVDAALLVTSPEPDGPDWQGGRGSPPEGPRPPDMGSSEDKQRKRYLLYAAVAAVTLFAAYLGLAVGDSLQSSGPTLPPLPAPDGSLQSRVCSTVPVRLDMGTSLNLNFPEAPGGYDISNIAVSGGSVENINTLAQADQSVLFIAKSLPSSTGQNEEYQLGVTFARGNQTVEIPCRVIVQGIEAPQPTMTPAPSETPAISADEPTATISAPPLAPTLEPDTPTPLPTSSPTVTGTPPTATPTKILPWTPTPQNTATPIPVATATGTLIPPLTPRP